MEDPTQGALDDGAAARARRRAPRGDTFQPDVYPRVLSLLPPDRGTRILDLGAGEGYFSEMLRGNGYRDVMACDHNPARYRGAPGAFRAADLSDRLPFDDAAFDCVVSIEVVEHIANHPRFFSELFRVLRAGGIAIVTTPNIQSLASRMHFLVHGNTDGARRPLDPARESWQQHTHCIGLQQLIYYTRHHGAPIERIATNRTRLSSLLMLPLAPLLFVLMVARLRRRIYRERGRAYWEYIRAALAPATLVGRILIIVARKGWRSGPDLRRPGRSGRTTPQPSPRRRADGT